MSPHISGWTVTGNRRDLMGMVALGYCPKSPAYRPQSEASIASLPPSLSLAIFLWPLSSHPGGTCHVDTGVPFPPLKETKPRTACPILHPSQGLDLILKAGGGGRESPQRHPHPCLLDFEWASVAFVGSLLSPIHGGSRRAVASSSHSLYPLTQR